MYRIIPSLVVAIFMDTDNIYQCMMERYCIKTEHNPYGIPLWKMFDFMFWALHSHPLGKQWTINPEPWGLASSFLGGATYFGFSIQSSCNSVPFVPHSERAKDRIAFIMSKYIQFFSPGENTAWEIQDFNYAGEETGVRYISGARPGNGVPGALAVPDKLENFGYLPQPEFLKALAKSTILIGVGMPKTYVHFLSPLFIVLVIPSSLLQSGFLFTGNSKDPPLPTKGFASAFHSSTLFSTGMKMIPRIAMNGMQCTLY